MVTDILTATPVMGWIAKNPALNWGLTWPLVGIQLLLLFALWRGIRAAFAAVGGDKAQGLAETGGLVCYLLSLAIALWSELVPLTQDDGFFGPSILEQYEWLYYGRSIAFIALQIYLLVCIARQSGALADRGYAITPVPVRFAPRTVLLGVFGAVLLSLPIALWFGGPHPHRPGGAGLPPDSGADSRPGPPGLSGAARGHRRRPGRRRAGAVRPGGVCGGGAHL